ncbi:MAG: PQQ-binding-like beta-propeller repeat protein [Opitutales bacterium]
MPTPMLFTRGVPVPGLAALLLSGWFFLGAARLVLAASPAPDPIEGRWTGTVASPQGTTAEIGLEFLRARDGTLIFRLNFPEMFTYGVTFGIPVNGDTQGNYAVVPAFDLRLHLSGDRLAGTFGPGRLPLALQRGGAWTPKPPAQVHPAAPAPRWRHNLGGPTWAAPVVCGETVYVGTEKGAFHAVRATDGRTLWTWQGTTRIDGAALVTEERVYFLDGSISLVCLDRATGVLVWRTPLHNAALAGKPVPDNPTFNHRSATPLLADGVLYAGSSDGGLYAVDAAAGNVLWRHEAHAPIFSTVTRSGPDTLLFGTMDGSAVLLDRRTRREILRVHTGGGVVTAPLVADGCLVIGSRDYQLYGFHLADGTEAWRHSYWFSWVESSPVLRDGLVYVGASDYRRVTVLEPATGRVRWSTEVQGMNWGTPLVTASRVFTGTVNQNIPGTAIEHTAGLIALDRASGAVRWQFVLPKAAEGGFAGFAGSLALAGDAVIAAGFDGWLYAFPAD